MREEVEKARRNAVKKWQAEYEQEIKSCLDEAEEYAKNHPTAKKCIIKRRGELTKKRKFRIALQRSASEQEMAALFCYFGRIEIWFDEIDCMANYF